MSVGRVLFCFGYGYVCEHLGRALKAEDKHWVLRGTTRDPDKAVELRQEGIAPHIFEDGHPLNDPLDALKDVTHLLLSVPPDDGGDPVFRAHGSDIAKLKNLQWVGYISATSVYGDREGLWVDETSEIRPSTIRGSRRVKAEDQWRSLWKTDKVPVHIFRLSGIYGPGRSALESIKAGHARRIDKPGHAFGRIHVEDISQVLKLSMEHPNPGTAYNVTDDVFAPSHEVISYACQLMGRPEPELIPYERADLAPITRSFYADNKRVHNKKIKEELGVCLKYPSYKEGLQACLDRERQDIPTIFKPTG